MNRWRLFSGVSVVFFATAALIAAQDADTQESAPPPKRAQQAELPANSRLMDSKRRFTLRFPSGWDVKNLETLQGRWDVMFMRPFGETPNVGLHFTWFDSADLDGIYAAEKQRYFTGKGTEILKEEKTNLGEYEARLISAKADDIDVRFSEMYVIRGHGKVVRFTMSFQKEDAALREELTQLIKAVKLR